MFLYVSIMLSRNKQQVSILTNLALFIKELTMNKLIARINAKTLSFYLFMTAFIGMIFAYVGADLEKLSTTDGIKYGSFTGAAGDKGSLDTSLSRLFDIGKYIAIVIGIFMAIGGLMSVSKATKPKVKAKCQVGLHLLSAAS